VSITSGRVDGITLDGPGPVTAGVLYGRTEKGCCDATATQRRRHQDAIDGPHVGVTRLIATVADDEAAGEHVSQTGPWLDTAPETQNDKQE
jgi:hypothetical protein